MFIVKTPTHKPEFASLMDALYFPWEMNVNIPITDPRIYEENDQYIIELDLPGFKKEDIKVAVKKECLNISGKSERKEFDRGFSLPEYWSKDKINASLKDGVLKIVFNIKEEDKDIEIVVR